MRVIIKKTADIVVDIPDDKVKSFFGENTNESDFIQWADNNMYLSCPDLEDSNEDSKGPQIEAWVNSESTHGITIEDKRLPFLKDEYTEKDITEITDERERVEHCYECGGYGDDYSYDSETGELVCNCDTCPFNGRD